MPDIHVARAFNVLIDDGRQFHFEPGIHRDVDAAVANHWYVRHHLVDAPEVEPAAGTPEFAERARQEKLERDALEAEQKAKEAAAAEEEAKQRQAALEEMSRQALAQKAEQAEALARKDEQAAAIQTAGDKPPEGDASGDAAVKDDLLKQAAELGITIDKRWGVARLQSEIDAALAK